MRDFFYNNFGKVLNSFGQNLHPQLLAILDGVDITTKTLRGTHVEAHCPRHVPVGWLESAVWVGVLGENLDPGGWRWGRGRNGLGLGLGVRGQGLR